MFSRILEQEDSNEVEKTLTASREARQRDWEGHQEEVSRPPNGKVVNMSITIDLRLLLSPSEELVDFLRKKALDSPPENVRKLVDSDNVQLTVDDIRWIVEACPDLPSSSLVVPSPKFPERNPVLEARCQQLRKEQEDREYKAMTGNVRREGQGGQDQEPFKKQFKEINNFLLIIAQFVLSVACSFMFGFLAPYSLYGRADLGPRLLFGIICAFIVGCADMYFVISQMLEESGITDNR